MAERIPALKPEAPPPRRRAGKLLWIVIALFVIALVVLFFRSQLSRITDIEVTGATYAKTEDVMNALGVREGDSFFKGNPKEIEARVQSLGPVKSAKVTKHFPGRLKVEIQEYGAVAVELGDAGNPSLVLASGLSIPLASGASPPDMPILTGWSANDPNRAALCAALGGLKPALLSDFSQIAPSPSQSYPDRIEIYTRSKFEIVTTIGKLPDKIGIISEIVENREPGLITLLEVDTYKPYSAQTEQENDS